MPMFTPCSHLCLHHVHRYCYTMSTPMFTPCSHLCLHHVHTYVYTMFTHMFTPWLHICLHHVHTYINTMFTPMLTLCSHYVHVYTMFTPMFTRGSHLCLCLYLHIYMNSMFTPRCRGAAKRLVLITWMTFCSLMLLFSKIAAEHSHVLCKDDRKLSLCEKKNVVMTQQC